MSCAGEYDDIVARNEKTKLFYWLPCEITIHCLSVKIINVFVLVRCRHKYGEVKTWWFCHFILVIYLILSDLPTNKLNKLNSNQCQLLLFLPPNPNIIIIVLLVDR